MSEARVADPRRVVGGLWGLLVGDALGVPYEFHDPRNLPARDQLQMTPPAGFRRSHAGTPPGTWSDDGAQALCLLASLLDCGRLDVDDLGRRLLNWANHGYMAVDGRVFDIGNQTSVAMRRLERGVAAASAGPASDQDNGNGSLMRVLPLALWHRGSDADLIADARQQSVVTHGHVRSQLCCALYVVWARNLLFERANAWEAAVETVREQIDVGEVSELELILGFSPAKGSGYVVDSLASVRVALAEPTYPGVVQRAVAFGQDTDTTACIAGGLAGIRDGVDGIPETWRAALRGRDLLGPLVARLEAR